MPATYSFLKADDIAPFVGGAAVTTNDGTDLPNGVTRAVYVGGAGALKADMADGSTVTFSGMLVGQIYAIRCKRIYATGTVATNIIALY